MTCVKVGLPVVILLKAPVWFAGMRSIIHVFGLGGGPNEWFWRADSQRFNIFCQGYLNPCHDDIATWLAIIVAVTHLALQQTEAQSFSEWHSFETAGINHTGDARQALQGDGFSYISMVVLRFEIVRFVHWKVAKMSEIVKKLQALEGDTCDKVDEVQNRKMQNNVKKCKTILFFMLEWHCGLWHLTLWDRQVT